MDEQPRPLNGPRPRRPTLSDVAAHAGVSSVTVSRALRRPEMVSADLRERVARAVEVLGYIPNQLASALASARTGTIGVLIPSLTNGVFADYLKALHDAFLPIGFQVLVLNWRYEQEEEEKAAATMLGQHPEAMILAGIDQSDNVRRMIELADIPVVQTMELTDDPIDINIGISQIEAAYAATRHLLDLGHRRIGHISARLDARARRRIDGYRRAMTEAGIDTTDTIAASRQPSTFALGAALFTELTTNMPDVEAVFASNDDIAMGAMFECHRRGLRVPDDISIIGFNDVEICASSYPSLSSVATPRYEMGRQAAAIVTRIIRGDGDAAGQPDHRSRLRDQGAGQHPPPLSGCISAITYPCSSNIAATSAARIGLRRLHRHDMLVLLLGADGQPVRPLKALIARRQHVAEQRPGNIAGHLEEVAVRRHRSGDGARVRNEDGLARRHRVATDDRTAFLDDTDQSAGDDEAVDDGAAHADRGDRGVDRVVARVLRPGDEAERALGRREHDAAGALVRVEHELVEGDLRLGANRQRGLVQEHELGEACRPGRDDLVLEHLAADAKRAAAALDVVLHRSGNTNIGGRQGGPCRNSQGQRQQD